MRLSKGPNMHRSGIFCGEVLKKVAELETNGKLQEALLELKKIDGKYPEYGKIIQQRRGQLTYHLLEKENMLPPEPSIFVAETGK